MPTVSLTDPVAHTTADAGQIATNNGNLRTLLNGGIDYANLKGAPALAAGEVAVWDGANFVRSSATKIAATQLTGLGVYSAIAVISAANTDLANPGGSSITGLINISTGGGTLRSFGAGIISGQRIVFRNGHASSVTFKYNLAGGTGATLITRTGADTVVATGETIEFMWDGTYWIEVSRDMGTTVSGIGSEMAYNEFTAGTTTGGTTTEAGANTIVTATAITADGSAYFVDCYIPYAEDFGTNNIVFVLFMDAASIGKIGEYKGTGTDRRPLRLARRHIPAAGSRTYSLRAYNASAANNPNIVAGVGGSGAYMPGFIRITKAT